MGPLFQSLALPYVEGLRQLGILNLQSVAVVDVSPASAPGYLQGNKPTPTECVRGSMLSMDQYARTIQAVLRGYLARAGNVLQHAEWGSMANLAKTRNFGAGRIRKQVVPHGAPEPVLPIDGDEFKTMFESLIPHWGIRSHLSGADGTTQFVPKMLIIVAPGSVYVANLTLNFYRIDAANVEARNAHWALMWFHVGGDEAVPDQYNVVDAIVRPTLHVEESKGELETETEDADLKLLHPSQVAEATIASLARSFDALGIDKTLSQFTGAVGTSIDAKLGSAKDAGADS